MILRNTIRYTIYILFISLTSCSQESTFDKLVTCDDKDILLKDFESDKLNYKMSIPTNLTLVDSKYSNEHSIESFVDTSTFEKSIINTITVIKYKKSNSSLQKEWKKLKKQKNNLNFKVKSTGLIFFLDSTTYYEYLRISNEPSKNFETVTFLTNGKEKGEYFIISVLSTIEDNYPLDLQKLLKSVKTFKFTLTNP
jgi:hypothetical protein